VFVTGSAAVPDLRGVNRVFVTFTDAGGVLRGETSVAVRTQWTSVPRWLLGGELPPYTPNVGNRRFATAPTCHSFG
jgi:hypothetical protein